MESSNRKIMTRLPETKKVTLMTFAGKYRFLTGTGCVLSGISSVIALAPYLCMWNVVKEVVLTWNTGLDGRSLVHWGWLAVASSLISMLFYYGALTTWQGCLSDISSRRGAESCGG